MRANEGHDMTSRSRPMRANEGHAMTSRFRPMRANEGHAMTSRSRQMRANEGHAMPSRSRPMRAQRRNGYERPSNRCILNGGRGKARVLYHGGHENSMLRQHALDVNGAPCSQFIIVRAPTIHTDTYVSVRKLMLTLT